MFGFVDYNMQHALGRHIDIVLVSYMQQALFVHVTNMLRSHCNCQVTHCVLYVGPLMLSQQDSQGALVDLKLSCQYREPWQMGWCSHLV